MYQIFRAQNMSKNSWLQVGLGIVYFTVAEHRALAATVKKVSSKKGTITINILPDDAIETDSTVCIYNDSDKKIDCGTVTKVKGKTATVKMNSKKKIKKIKPDMSARVESDGHTTDSGEIASETNNKNPMGLKVDIFIP